jgi:restriction system protein
MKLKMSKNSLFAILLRSPWWMSFGLVAAIALAARALLPEP